LPPLKDLLIFGTGIHARKMADIVEAVNAGTPTFTLLGFLASTRDPDPPAELDGRPVHRNADRFPDAFIVPAYDTGPLDVDPERIVSLVAPTAFVSKSAALGRGCVIYPGCFIGADARLGNRVFVLANSVINHDCILEDEVTLATGGLLAGSVHVEKGCYLGQGCTVREMLRIGKGSLIGMGAVVVTDVEPEGVMAGNPARKLRQRSGISS
jgi:acetyltransferase-like isoleucine patch superfamily enzyme